MIKVCLVIKIVSIRVTINDTIFKLVKLLSINNAKELFRLGKFLQQATILRNDYY